MVKLSNLTSPSGSCGSIVVLTAQGHAHNEFLGCGPHENLLIEVRRRPNGVLRPREQLAAVCG